jgi:hypothetical protein
VRSVDTKIRSRGAYRFHFQGERVRSKGRNQREADDKQSDINNVWRSSFLQFLSFHKKKIYIYIYIYIYTPEPMVKGKLNTERSIVDVRKGFTLINKSEINMD